MAKLTFAQVNELLKYDPKTGKLFWMPRTREMFGSDQLWKMWNSRFSGKEAFTSDDGNGYRQGAILGKLYRAHRVIWLLQYGEWPKDEIDHINGCRSDNTIINLRLVSTEENSRNQKVRNTNTSGYVGVFRDKRGNDGKWYAAICSRGRNIHIGVFETVDAAIEARKLAEKEFGFHPNHGRA